MRLDCHGHRVGLERLLADDVVDVGRQRRVPVELHLGGRPGTVRIRAAFAPRALDDRRVQREALASSRAYDLPCLLGGDLTATSGLAAPSAAEEGGARQAEG